MQPDFYEIRIVEVSATSIILDNREIRETVSNFISGAGIRALVGGSWGLSNTENLERINEALETAITLARATNQKTPREKIELAPIEKPRLKNLPEVRKRPGDVEIEEKLQMIKEIAEAAQQPEITSVSAAYMESEVRVEYMNSEGIEASYTLPRIGFSITAVAQENGNYQMARDSRFAVSGFELFTKYDALEIASKTADVARDLLRAKSVKGGVMPVVLDPELAGVFIHEAVGHAVEADHVLEGNSVLEDRLNTQIASPLLTVYDDPSMHEYGYYPFDDEGAQSRKTVLIERGVLKNYLHNRETAGKLGGTPCNARAQGYAKPIIRMSNTYIEQGESSFEEMLEEVKNGVYLIGSRGGQVSPGEGVFQFNAERGYLIEGGELTTLLRDVSLSGTILETLKHITMVGCDLEMHAGQCGKAGQLVPVSDGSPHILVTNALVGGSG
jgi:TldD protein